MAGAWEKITWTGGEAVPGGTKNKRRVTRATSAKTNVKAAAGGTSKDLDVWIIWSTVTNAITGSISGGNDASGLVAGKWPANLGGGTGLAPIDKESTTLTYAYTLGRMEAKAVLTPTGIEDVITNTKWTMKRTVTGNGWDNGASNLNVTDKKDDSPAQWLDVKPKSGSSTREIYDLDVPGCSVALPGTTIDHTSEVYVNFQEWAQVTLDADERISDKKPWSYEARVDVDKAMNKVERNILRTSHIMIRDAAHYAAR